ncbi:MAG: hypothetical protein HN377_13250, partial [Alphaproteobacteria bacterium]|nr:hypothetical protein [Alphaproteobacteria bacterium]
MNTIVRYLDKVLLLAVAAFVSLALSWNAQAAQSGARNTPLCGERSNVLTTLSGKYAEKTVSMGLAGNGTVVEVLSSEDGTWTIL